MVWSVTLAKHELETGVAWEAATAIIGSLQGLREGKKGMAAGKDNGD